jgi:hypothetical protein
MLRLVGCVAACTVLLGRAPASSTSTGHAALVALGVATLSFQLQTATAKLPLEEVQGGKGGKGGKGKKGKAGKGYVAGGGSSVTFSINREAEGKGKAGKPKHEHDPNPVVAAGGWIGAGKLGGDQQQGDAGRIASGQHPPPPHTHLPSLPHPHSSYF